MTKLHLLQIKFTLQYITFTGYYIVKDTFITEVLTSS